MLSPVKRIEDNLAKNFDEVENSKKKREGEYKGVEGMEKYSNFKEALKKSVDKYTEEKKVKKLLPKALSSSGFFPFVTFSFPFSSFLRKYKPSLFFPFHTPTTND